MTSMKFDMHRVSVNRMLGLFLFLFCLILIAGSRNVTDYSSYEFFYNSSISNGMERGYLFISTIFTRLGLSYDAFRFFIIGGSFLIIYATVRKRINNTFLFFIFYLLYPMLYDAIYLRNTVVTAILFFAIQYLQEYSRENVIKYILCIIIAILFHRIAIVYLLFLFVFSFDNKRIKQIVYALYVAAALVTIAMLVNRSFLSVTMIAFRRLFFSSGFVDTNRIGQLDSILGNYGFLLFGFVNFCFFIIFYMIKKHSSGENDTIVNLGLYVNLICLLFVPLYLMDSNYFRIYRNIIPINYMLLIYIYENVSERRISRRIILFTTVLSVLLFYLFTFQTTNVLPSFSDNMLF